MDEQKGTTDMAAAVPLKGSLDEGAVETIKLPASKGFVVDYYGPYEGVEYAHKALDYHIRENWLTQKPPVIESYVTDPSQEPDTTKWLTKIYYLVE
jgi:effector-binding domain-containing protein